MKLSENPVFHDRSKHVEIQYHYIQDMVERRAVQLQYIPTNDQIADILTKTLPKGKFVYFRDRLGVQENASLAERECSCLQHCETFSLGRGGWRDPSKR